MIHLQPRGEVPQSGTQNCQHFEPLNANSGGSLCVGILTPEKSILRMPGVNSSCRHVPRPDAKRVSFVPDVMEDNAGGGGYRISEEVTEQGSGWKSDDWAYDFRIFGQSLLLEDEDWMDNTDSFRWELARAVSLCRANEFYCEAHDVQHPPLVPVVWTSHWAFVFTPHPYRIPCTCEGNAEDCHCYEKERFLADGSRWGEPTRFHKEQAIIFFDNKLKDGQLPPGSSEPIDI